MSGWASFVEGRRDACQSIGIPIPDGMEEGDVRPPDVIDNEEYMRGQIATVVEVLGALDIDLAHLVRVRMTGKGRQR